MKVRGAPAIAITAALSLAAEAHHRRSEFASAAAASEWLFGRLEYLKTSRPTAVNLFQATDHLEEVITKYMGTHAGASAGEVLDVYIAEAEKMLQDDVAANKAIGDHGAADILSRYPSATSLQILTHCNTGSLATAGYGTALGVIRSLQREAQSRGFSFHVYCTETRPYNQGARLTAFELVHEKIPATLICDSMAAFLMKQKKISAVVVGADRVVANGDTANKIGTYALAIMAQYHGVPFYVAAPTTTLDPTIPTGDLIKIEERPAAELTDIFGQRLAAPGIGVWNPAFDVTPGTLVTGIITELGVIYPPYDIPAFFAKHNLTYPAKSK
jgi:methylthioribose-1-phosphate isomerase